MSGFPPAPEESMEMSDTLYVDKITSNVGSTIEVINGAEFDMGGKNIRNIADPVLDDDAATKMYVDSNFAEGNNSKYCDLYDSIGGLVLSPVGNYVDVPFNMQRRFDSNTYSHSTGSSEIEFLADGTYLIFARCSTYLISGTTRTQSEMRLMIDTGTGYNEIGGSLSYMYNREVLEGFNTGISNLVLDVVSGVKIKMQARLKTGSTQLRTAPNGSSIVIFKVEGLIGPKGQQGASGDLRWAGQWTSTNYTANDVVEYLGSAYVCILDTTSSQNPTDGTYWELLASKGNTGSGSNVSVLNDGNLIGLFNNLNFGSSFNVTDAGSGTVNIDFDTDVKICRLSTNTNDSVNNNGASEIRWTLPTIVNSIYTVSPNNKEVTVGEDGYYEIYVNLVMQGTVQRFNNIIRILVNGVPTGPTGRGGYIRFWSNHDSSSNNLKDIVKLNAGDIISVTTQQEAASGTVRMISGESLLLIKKL